MRLTSELLTTFDSQAIADILKLSLDHMPRRTNPRKLWLAMISVSATPRILGAFFLPNAFGDAYVYIRDIGAMSIQLSTLVKPARAAKIAAATQPRLKIK